MGLMNAFAGLAQGLGAYGQAADRAAQLKLDQQRQQYMMDHYKAEDERRRRDEMQQGVDNTAILRTINPTGYAEAYGDMGNRPSSVTAPSAKTQLDLFKVQESKRQAEEEAAQQKLKSFAAYWYLNGGPQTDPTGEKFMSVTGRNPFELVPESVLNSSANRDFQREMKQEGYRQAQILAGMRGGGGEKEYKPDLFVNAQGQTAWVKPGDPIPQGFFPHSNSMGIEVNQDGTTTINTNGKLKPIPNAAASSLTANFGVMSRIQSALNANAEAPDAGGMFYGMINDVAPTMMNKIDPGGTEARATTGDVSSMVIHDRSGAAVTVSEYPRFRPFIPTVYDSYEEKQKKLELLYKAIELETRLYADNFSEGYRMPESWGKYLGSSPVVPEKGKKTAREGGGGGWGNDLPEGFKELP